MAAVAASTILAPSIGQAGPAQEEPGADETSGPPVIDIEADAASADVTAVAATLDEIQANVTAQLAQLDAAKAAVTAADQAVMAADQAVAETQAKIDVLVAQSDAIVVESFVSPPAAGAVETLASATAADATIRQALLGMRADADADVLAELDETREAHEELQDVQARAVDDAELAMSDAEAALDDLEAASSQQAQFIALVNERLNQGLAEVDSLAKIDPAMAAEMAARQAGLAGELQAIMDAEAFQAAMEALAAAQRQAEAEAAARPPAPVQLGAASGSLAEVGCPSGGGSIVVDSTLGSSLGSLLNAANADGVNLCGSGYRSPDEQVEVRRANCGTSYYAIYEAPASYCSPPTAPPGTSMHEQGLAIDFTCNGGGVISSRGSVCYQWLDANAAGYGLYNLPSEPWHFSTNGR